MAADVEYDPEFGHAFPRKGSRPTFRIVHLLAIIGIIGLLIALFFPATRSVGPAARRAQCVNNLKQIALALRNYEGEYNVLPPAYTVDSSGRRLHSWRTLILPYMEMGELYKTIDLSKPWDDPANAKARQTSVQTFWCPGAPERSNLTSYRAVVAPGGCFQPNEPRRLSDIKDDQSLTLMVVEVDPEHAIPWMAPVDANEVLILSLAPKTKLNHAEAINVAYVDGGVRSLRADTPAARRRAMITIAGGDDELAGEPD